MKLDPKWLLPPAAALCLLLGPLAMGNGAGNATAPAPAPAGARAAEQPATGPTLPKTPDLWQVVSTLCGVVLLGVAGVWFARRMQRGAASTNSGSIALRQTLRLSAKQSLYVVEFDDRLLLVGAGDAGLTLLDQARSPERAADEAAMAARAEPEDEGAVPRDLLIPRPAEPRQPRLPTPPGQKRTPALGDFRALLQKAGKA